MLTNSTDEDPGLRIESFAIIKLRGVTTKLNIIFFHHEFMLEFYWSVAGLTVCALSSEVNILTLPFVVV